MAAVDSLTILRILPLPSLSMNPMGSVRMCRIRMLQMCIRDRYDSTVEKMMKLKAESKEKTVTYRQLFANKLQLQAMLSYYRAYGLIENEE